MILLTDEEMEVQMVNKFIQDYTALKQWSWCSRTDSVTLPEPVF